MRFELVVIENDELDNVGNGGEILSNTVPDYFIFDCELVLDVLPHHFLEYQQVLL